MIDSLPAGRRRRLVLGIAPALASLAAPALAAAGRALAPMTEGPFYPPRAWREQWTDWDADLSRVQRGGEVRVAQGELLGLELRLQDTGGRVIDGAEIEIWQCDALGTYRHPGVRVAAGRRDENFQGFGATRSGAAGEARFRTIRPVPYPGRAPHIHIRLRHPSFGETTSQLFVAGDAGNERDFLWRELDPAQRAMLDMTLRPAPQASGLRWTVRQDLVLPA